MANGAPEGRKRGGDGGILVSCEALWLGMGASHRLARLTRFFRLDFASCSWCIVIEWHLQYPLDGVKLKTVTRSSSPANATPHALIQRGAADCGECRQVAKLVSRRRLAAFPFIY